jgi:hypothetical protein
MARSVAFLLIFAVGHMAGAQEVTALAFVPDGKVLVAAGADGRVRCLDGDSGRFLGTVPAHAGGVFGLALSPNGTLLATCGADATVKLWKFMGPKDPPLQEIKTLIGHDKEVVAVAFAPDGHTLASGGYDHSVRLWQVDSGNLLAKLEGQRGRITSLAFSPHGKMLASAGNGKFELFLYQDDKVHFWDLKTRKLLETIPQEAHQIAFAQDGRSLVAVRDYATFTKKKARIFNGESHSEMALWDLRRGREVFPFREYQQTMAVSADGKWMATGWGTSLHRNYMSFPYDTSSATKGIQLWELASGKPVLWRKAATDEATALAFSPDGTRLAAGGKNGAVRVHPVAGDSWLPGRRLKLEKSEDLWKALLDNDAASAYEAIAILAGEGDKAVSFLQKQLEPVVPVSAKVRNLIKELDDENFKTRDAANRELLRAGSAAEMELRRTLQAKPTLETELRVQKLLNILPFQPPSPEEIRQSRAIVVLGRIGTEQARRHLETLAGGEPDALLTQEAQSCLRHLSPKASQRGAP